MSRECGAVLLLLLLGLAGGGCASVDPPSPPTTLEATSAESGLYTTDQAQRGQRVFSTICSSCHSPSEFSGRRFESNWTVEPIGQFFQYISRRMPQGRAGSLSADEYASIVAYVLQLNGRPSGSRELPADPDLLDRVRWQ